MNLIPLAMILSVVGVVFGLLMFCSAPLIIDIQIKTAARSNWRMEPISMEKELKNTKISGINLIIVCVLAIMYVKFFMN